MTEREIFLAALDLQDPADRERFLEQACGGDARLRAAIDALFHSHQEAGGFLQTPLVQSPIPPGTSSAEASDQTVHLTKEQLARDAAEQESDDSQSLEFLSPSIKPGALGRLAHYEVLEVLGRGAFGTVLKAFDEKLHRMVAIKVMSNELASTSPARKRFLREARSSAAVRHENVVAIHAVEEQPLPYLVMEYIPGQTLQQALDGHGPLELPDILRLGQQIASGLAAAHSQGLIHRDIKPANILLEDGIQWKVKITDFGLARAADDASVTQSGMIAGTPMFMSPEQAHTNQIDQRSDLFSFGSVLYQMTSGRPPFRAPTTLAVLRRVTEETPHPIREIIPETPEWLCTIISRLHEKRPEDRYQTAREVADLLGRCQLELQLTGQVTCVPGAGSDIVTNGVGTEPVSQTESIPGNSATSPAAAPSVRRGVDGGAGARWKTARTALLSILTGLLIMSPILFGKRISNLVSPWIWGQIPTLPTVERAAGLRFDGKDDFIQIPMKWDTPLLTIEAFVTPDGFAAGGTVLQLTNERSAQAESIELFDEPSQAGKPQSFAGLAGGESHGTIAAPLSRAFRQHRAVTVDGSEMHYYVNGQWQGKRKVQPADQTQWKLRQLTIGCKEDRTNFFTGTIDQVRISKVIRYSSEFSPLTTLSSDDATLALYDFDDGTGDVLKESSGNGTDGKIFGATWVHPVQGLHFDGVDDYVDFENLAWTSNEYTFETWLTPLANHGTVFQTAIPEGHLHAYFYPGGSGTGLKRDKSYVSVNGPSQGTKRLHLATVFDGRNLSYFVNGKLAGSRTSVSELTTPWKFERMRLGTKLEPDAGKPEFFHGRIAQFRVSKSALYVLPFTPADRFTADAQTLALYNFDEGTGDVLKDISGHGHDGQIVGATWAKASVRPGPDGGTNTLPGGHKQEGSDPALTDSGWHRWPADAPKPAIAPFNAEQAKKHQEEWAAYLEVPVEYTNSIGMRFQLIPPGEFLMGSSDTEIEAAAITAIENKEWLEHIRSERPVHDVILTQPFYLGRHEVTQSQFAEVTGENPSHYASTGQGEKIVAGMDTGTHPVERVAWNDAFAFCNKLSLSEGVEIAFDPSAMLSELRLQAGYRLPTEAEWEFACRAGTTTRFWTGDDPVELAEAAWFRGPERTQPVGLLRENPYGLYDVHGNVWEWVFDSWSADYYAEYAERPAINPLGPDANSKRVFRGGLFAFPATACRSAGRHAIDPAFKQEALGFRAALSVNAVRDVIRRQPKVGWHGWPADAPKPAIAPFNAEQARKHQDEWATYLKVPVEYTNSIGMKFRLIPPGEFLMGSTEEEIEPRLNVDPGNTINDNFLHSELPRHRVILTQPVYIGVYEVTQENYEKLMEVNPSFHSPTGMGREKVVGQVTSTYPVESVDWNDATRFCAKLSRVEQHRPFYSHSGDNVSMMKGTGYRLPTEAEWEFACRSGTTTRSWAGDRDLDLLAVGWFQENSEGRTHAVGELKPNPFGLYDLQGNVWEWLQDWWGPGYYAEFRETTAIDPAGPVSGEMRVLRGVEAKSLVAGCAASVRGGGSPSGTRNAHFGFRTALPIDAVRRALHATGPGIPKPVATTASVPASAPIDFAAERQTAEWSLANKGAFTLAVSPTWWDWQVYAPSSEVKPLPNEPFAINALDFRDGQVRSNEDLQRIASCRYIEVLVLSAAGFDHQGIDLLGQLPRLKSLNLPHHRNLKTSALSTLGQGAALNHLAFTSDMVDDQLEFVRHLPTLRTLRIFGPRSPEITLLAEAPQLRTIVLETPDTVDDARLAAVQSRHDKLRIVIVWGDKFRVVGRDPAHEAAKHLVGLGVECLGAAGYGQASPRLLTKADFDDNQAWLFDVRSIPATVQLSESDREELAMLDSYHFTAEGQREADELARTLSTNHAIASITVTDCDLTDEGLAHLQMLKSLRSINVTKTKVTREGVDRFHQAVPMCGVTSDFGITVPAFMLLNEDRPKSGD